MIKPYFETKLGKLYHGDCLEVMKEFPEDIIDLTITSPPYDQLRSYQGFDFNFEGIAHELFRITKPGGVVVWVVSDQVIKGSESGTSFKHALFFKEIGFDLHDTMIYQKSGFRFPDKTRYHQVFEYMFVFSKGKPKVINLIKDRRNRWDVSFGKQSERQVDGTLKRKKAWRGIQVFGVRHNIFRYNNGAGHSTKDMFAYEHPAMFPEQLAIDHLISWSNPGDLILDCMCGAGTTLKMAERHGRKWIGIDVSERYCEISKERILIESQQGKLPMEVKV